MITARYFVQKIMELEDSNLLVVRKVYRTNKDSTYSELRKAINDLGVAHLWSHTTSPMELTYKPTGQKILFRGLDDPQKISGVTVEKGHLCWVWIEEGYEMKEERELDFIDESIRGILPKHLWYQITITFNPWNKSHWMKKRFFDPIYGEKEEFKKNPKDDPDVFATTTNYLMNEWIDDSFRGTMHRMSLNNPKRYNVAGLGNWGVTEGVIFEQWYEEEFNPSKFLKDRRRYKPVYGLDFGWTDETAFIAGFVDDEAMLLYIYDEIYEQKLTNKKLFEKLKYKGHERAEVRTESAEPKDIRDMYDHGLRRVVPADKGAGSILYGIRKIQEYTIVVHPKCQNFMMELENYIWDPKKANTPMDEFNHLMDALRYAMEYIPSNSPYHYVTAS